MAVVIRMKKMGRRHRPFFRICAMDQRSARNGRAIEELGTYDPMVGDIDARATLKADRIDYWLGVGAKPSDKVKVLIKKYGTDGTHVEKRKATLERMAALRARPMVTEKTETKPAEQETESEQAAQAETTAEAEQAAEPNSE